MSIAQGIVATHRIGLGPRPGELDFLSSDPKAWLLGQISDASTNTKGVDTPSYLSSTEVLSLQAELRQARGMFQNPGANAEAGSGNNADEQMAQQLNRNLRRALVGDSAARLRFGVTTKTPFVERLVYFWSNHFAISMDKIAVAGMGGSFESEAIRPNIFGRFEDLLMASTKHPGMLLYLDNALSIGPNSRGGQRRGRGLNENLAREILELHTLGVNGGYSQQDVTNFAKIITGWTVPNDLVPQQFTQRQGSFSYVDLAHEPGSHILLGKTYNQNGLQQGEAALKDLAIHSSTAEHIATKLAQHFIADQPPASAIAALKDSFLTSGGDLPSLYRTLLNLDVLWAEPKTKYRTPNEWLIALLRGLGTDGITATTAEDPLAGLSDTELSAGLQTLGQPIWRPGSPAGWPDSADRWTSADALGKRIEVANTLAQRIGSGVAAPELLNRLYGSKLNLDLKQSVEKAESNAQALTLIAMSPDFLRR